MRQNWERVENLKKTRRVDETNELIENLQIAIIDWKREILDILYDEMFDISEINREKKIDILYDEMIIFSEVDFLKIEQIIFANVCWFKLFEFEVFEFWLIDLFWLTADLK